MSTDHAPSRQRPPSAPPDPVGASSSDCGGVIPIPDESLTPALGRAVGRGMSFTAANSILSKLISFLAFTVLGWLLTDHDFGLYAMAFSIAAFLQVFRDGGVVQLLIQRGEKEYETLLGPVFWMAFTFNAATACVLAVIGPIVATQKGEPMLASLIWVLAATLPLATPSIVLQARLQMDLRFGYLAGVSLGSSVIRYGGTIGLALAGFGPLSFVIPMPVMAVYEGVAYYLAVGQTPWKRRPRVRVWRELFAQSKWLIFFSLSVAALNQGGYLIIGVIVAVEHVGVFAFAYQLISQVDALLGTLGTVLFPALARLNSDRARQNKATLRAIRILMFLACPAALGLAAIVGPLEQMLWHGKWHDAVWPVQAMAVFYAARILITVPNAGLQARGLFRANAVLTLLAGVGLTIAAGIGAEWGSRSANPDVMIPSRIAECMGVATGLFCGFLAVWGLKRMGIGRREVVMAVAPTWAIAVVSAAGAVGADLMVSGHLEQLSAAVADRLALWGVGAAGSPGVPIAIAGFVRLVVAFTAYCAVYGVLQRVLAPARLREAMAVAPGRLRVLGERAALLGSE